MTADEPRLPRPRAAARLWLIALAPLLAPAAAAQCGLVGIGDFWEDPQGDWGLGDRVYVDGRWMLLEANPFIWTVELEFGPTGAWEPGPILSQAGRKARGIAVSAAAPDEPLMLFENLFVRDLSVSRRVGFQLVTLPGLPTLATPANEPVHAAIDPERVVFTDGGDLHVYRLEPNDEYAHEATLAGLPGPYLALEGERIVAMGPATASCLQTGTNCERSLSVLFDVGGGNWVQEAALTPLIPTHAEDGPMAPVDLSGDLLAMSGFREGDPECSVLVYRRTGQAWALEAVLTAADVAGAGEIELFGAGVGIEGDTLVVTSFAYPTSQMISHVFTYAGNVWTPRSSAIHAENVTRFGGTVLDEGRFTFGAPDGDSPYAQGAGMVRTYVLGPPHDVTEDPHDRTVRPGEILSLEVELEEPGPPLPGTSHQYRWRRNGTPLFDNNRVFGSGTDRLTIWGANAFDVGLYDVVVTRTPCGEDVTSQAARLGVLGGPPAQSAELFDSTGGVDRFGAAVAIEGRRMLVGAPRDSDAGPQAGAVFAYRESHGFWFLDQKILPPAPGQGGGLFGNAVAMRGDVAVVGAVDDDSSNAQNDGAAYVYRRVGNLWQLEATFYPPIGNSADFGHSVALDGDRILVGSPKERTNSLAEAGAAYIYRRNPGGWSREDILTAPVPQAGARFGQSVALSGDVAVIAAPLEDTAFGTNAGAVHVWTRESLSWNFEQELAPSSSNAQARFGQSVAATGNGAWIAAGAPRDHTMATRAGAAHVFRRQDGPGGPTWDAWTKRYAPDATFNDRFGNTVALSGELLAVGAYLGNGAANQSGSAYLFHGQTFAFEAELQAAGGASGDWFGVALASDGAQVAVGATFDDSAGNNSGSVVVFDL